MSEFAEKIKSINIARASRREPKRTVDVHDHHRVEVTEHYDERVDVNVLPETIRVKAKAKVQDGGKDG